MILLTKLTRRIRGENEGQGAETKEGRAKGVIIEEVGCQEDFDVVT